MLSRREIKKVAAARLKDSKVLLSAKRFDGAVYLCGYVIELGLKARICKTLNWQNYPETKKDFENYRSFKTHDLDILLHLSGIEKEVKSKFFAEWSAVSQWNPEARYQSPGNVAPSEARQMVNAAEKLLKKL